MNLRYPVRRLKIIIIVALLFITSLILRISYFLEKRSVIVSSNFVKVTKTSPEIYENQAIWCMRNASPYKLANEQFKKTTYYAPRTIKSRRERLLYSYSNWKQSNILHRQLSPCEHTILMRLLTIIADICIENRISFLMMNGTLLGSWRHHDVIPWDEDADLLMSVEHQPRFIEALRQPKYSAVWYTLLPVSKRPERSFKVFFHNTSCAANHCAWNFPSVDIILYNISTSHLWYTNDPRIRMPLRYIFPLVIRPFGYLWLPAPREPQKLLSPNIEDECITHSYDHRHEKAQKSKKYRCSDFYNIYPFVQRTGVHRRVETLVIHGNVIHTIIYPFFNNTA